MAKITVTYNGQPVSLGTHVPPSTIDVEATFSAFVRLYGGEVLEDTLGSSPDFSNADYLFRGPRVVVELSDGRQLALFRPEGLEGT